MLPSNYILYLCLVNIKEIIDADGDKNISVFVIVY